MGRIVTAGRRPFRVPQARNLALIAAWFGAFVLLTLVGEAAAQPLSGGGAPPFAETSRQEAPRKGRLALVLSGGGAAGAAHVGVIRALEESGLRPDCIAGASMGAIVGGLYAAGLGPDQLAEAVETTDWFSILDDRPRREQVHPLRRRSRLNKEVPLGRLPIGASKDGAARFDGGLVDAANLQLRLRELLLPAAGITDFDDFSIPFRATATDLATGQSVVMESGDLATALRASMSIPGVFAPVKIDGRVLVDGGVANNLPIDVGITLCADQPGDAVIAVSIPAADPDPAGLTTLTGALAQTISLFIAKSSRDQLAAWDGRYALITPPVENIGMLDFDRAKEAASLGYQVAIEAAPRIAARLYQGAEAPPSPPRVELTPRTHIDIADLNIINTSFYENAVIESYIDIVPPARIAISELNRRLQRLQALKAFEQVGYRLAPAPGGGDVLTIVAEGRNAGPVEFRLGAAFEDRFDGRARYALAGGVGFTGLDSLGARVDIDAAIGSTQAARVEVEKPLDPSQRWFLRGAARYVAYETPLSSRPGTRVADYRLQTTNALGAVLWAPYDATRFELGGRYRHTRAELSTGDPSRLPGAIEEEVAGPYIGVDMDTLDDAFVPTQGVNFAADFFAFGDPLLNGSFEGELRVEALAAVDVSGPDASAVSLQAFVRGEGDVNANDGQGFSAIGGFQRLTGFESNELINTVAGVAGVRVIADSTLLSELTGFNTFYGGGLEYGGAFGGFEDIDASQGYAAVSAFAGVRTRLGPLFIGAGAAEGGNDSIYLGFGERF